MSRTLLVIVTSHDEIAPGRATGLWFDEFAIPYERLRRAGFECKVASPQGGPVPLDPNSLDSGHSGVVAVAAQSALDDTLLLHEDMRHSAYAGLFFPGGHGAMFDLPGNPHVQRLVAEFLENDKPLGAICHGPAALVDAVLQEGTPAVQGRRVTAFSNAEERSAGLEGAMPFLLEDRLRERGAEVVSAEAGADHVVVDGRLVTGQNPQSSRSIADAMVRLLRAVD